MDPEEKSEKGTLALSSGGLDAGWVQAFCAKKHVSSGPCQEKPSDSVMRRAASSLSTDLTFLLRPLVVL